MFEIERPKIECKELNDYYGCFVVEPLERGFGTTLGNCLRRVLLRLTVCFTSFQPFPALRKTLRKSSLTLRNFV